VKEDKHAAAKQRLEAMIEAFDADPDDDEAVRELDTAMRRLAEQVARAITARPDLRSRIRGYVPERSEGRPATAEEERVEGEADRRY
jgi:hypothetical protein